MYSYVDFVGLSQSQLSIRWYQSSFARSAKQSAIRFLIEPSLIYICASSPIATTARGCVKKFYIGCEKAWIYVLYSRDNFHLTSRFCWVELGSTLNSIRWYQSFLHDPLDCLLSGFWSDYPPFISVPQSK
jgi:hypothetical protein